MGRRVSFGIDADTMKNQHAAPESAFGKAITEAEAPTKAAKKPARTAILHVRLTPRELRTFKQWALDAEHSLSEQASTCIASHAAAIASAKAAKKSEREE